MFHFFWMPVYFFLLCHRFIILNFSLFLIKSSFLFLILMFSIAFYFVILAFHYIIYDCFIYSAFECIVAICVSPWLIVFWYIFSCLYTEVTVVLVVMEGILYFKCCLEGKVQIMYLMSN